MPKKVDPYDVPLTADPKPRKGVRRPRTVTEIKRHIKKQLTEFKEAAKQDPKRVEELSVELGLPGRLTSKRRKRLLDLLSRPPKPIETPRMPVNPEKANWAKHALCRTCMKYRPIAAFPQKDHAQNRALTCMECALQKEKISIYNKMLGRAEELFREELAEQLRRKRNENHNHQKRKPRKPNAEKRVNKAAQELAELKVLLEEDMKAAAENVATIATESERAVEEETEKAAEAVEDERNEAQRELARRALCRRKLLPFIKRFNKSYEAGWVHYDICRRLEKFVEDVEKKRSPRLMLFMPPRHGKSEIASKNFPAWLLGRHPGWEIISASYAVSLPIGFSRKVQALIQDPYYKVLFPQTRLHARAQSAEAWMTDNYEGGYVAAGVGGGITGKGAHVLIIDDPVKDAEEADSQTQRDKVWDWWGSTAKTRLAPGGGVLVIQTRWHDDDLSGRLLRQMDETRKELLELIEDAERDEDTEAAAALRDELESIDQWEVVKYPAIATTDEYISGQDLSILAEPDDHPSTIQVRAQGEALHPARYPLRRLSNMRRSLQPRHWSALYQQNPVPDEGVFFTKDMLRFEGSPPPPEQMHLYAAWDLAIGEKQTNDYTVGSLLGMDWRGVIHVLDIVRFRGDAHQIALAIMSMYQRRPEILQIGIEKGQLELAIRPQLKLLMDEMKLYPTFNEELRPITDKMVRARPLQGRMQQGMVYFPQNQPWIEDVVNELLRFPGGVHDDIVDSLAWNIRMIGNAKPPPKPGESVGKSWRDKLLITSRFDSRTGFMEA